MIALPTIRRRSARYIPCCFEFLPVVVLQGDSRRRPAMAGTSRDIAPAVLPCENGGHEVLGVRDRSSGLECRRRRCGGIHAGSAGVFTGSGGAFRRGRRAARGSDPALGPGAWWAGTCVRRGKVVRVPGRTLAGKRRACSEGCGQLHVLCRRRPNPYCSTSLAGGATGPASRANDGSGGRAWGFQSPCGRECDFAGVAAGLPAQANRPLPPGIAARGFKSRPLCAGRPRVEAG